jgi:hypothetical protein
MEARLGRCLPQILHQNNRNQRPTMIAQRDDNPSVILPVKVNHDSIKFEARGVKGYFFRVWPKTAKEIFMMRMLIHREEKFAPANGGGIIVTVDAYKRYFKSNN